MKRRFNKEAYEMTKSSVKKIVEILEDKFFIKDNSETYEVDITIMDRTGRIIGLLDVEQRFKFIEEFPWKTIHIPTRKEKFMRQGHIFFYVVMNKNLNKCFITNSREILKCKKVIIKLRYEYGEIEDEFYDVPIEMFKSGLENINSYIEEYK